MKKLLALLAVFTLVFSIVGCSDKEEADKSTEEKAGEKETTELTDQVKSKTYNAARIAEGKVNDVFAHDVAADGETPILNRNFTDEAAAVTFLSKYYSEDVAKEIYAYYATAEKTAEGQVIVKAEPFFDPSLLLTKQEDMTIEGNANKTTLKQDEGYTYTVELKNNKYVVTDVQK